MARARKKADSTRNLRDAAQRFQLLAHPARLLILGAIATGELNPELLANSLGISRTAVNHHMSLLRAAEFFETTRAGSTIVYTLSDRGRAFQDATQKMIP